MRSATFLLLAPLGGCWMPSYVIGSSSSEWYEVPPVSKPPAEVAKMARDLLLRQGFRLMPEVPGETRAETEWDVHLSSHWRDGFRSKVEVAVEKADDGRTRTLVRSFREVNENAKNPSIPEQAIWGNASLDEKHAPKIGEPAIRVHQLLKLKLEGLSP